MENLSVELTTKQEAFINEYLKDFNATQAAIRAGYAENSAEVSGFRLLRNDKIQKQLQSYRSEIAEELRQQFVSDALAARKVMLEILNNPNASDRDRLTAARDLLDRAGFAPIDRKQLSGPNNEPIEIKFINPN